MHSMIDKQIADVERFRNVIGGREELEKFIIKLHEESGTGEIYEMSKKMQNQRVRRKDDYMPRKTIIEKKAFE